MKPEKSALEYRRYMDRHKQSQFNDILLKYCKVLGECYSTGDFTEIFPYLADDCVWESQWRLTPETGKEAVISYFTKKGLTLQKTQSFPKYLIVEFIDNINTIKNENIVINGKKENASFGLFYEEGKIALFMAQTLNDVTNGTIIDLTLDDDKKISRIDMCMPELFKFKKYEPEQETLKF